MCRAEPMRFMLPIIGHGFGPGGRFGWWRRRLWWSILEMVANAIADSKASNMLKLSIAICYLLASE